MEKLRLVEITNLASLGLLCIAILGGFSRSTRIKIHERAKKKNGGVLASEVSGRNDEPLQCAHVNHDKSDPYYDHESMGVLVTITEHLYDPLVGHLPASKKRVQGNGRLPNGLTPGENNWAIKSLRKQIADHRAKQAKEFFREQTTVSNN